MSRGVMRMLRQNPVSRRWRRLDYAVQRRLSIAVPYFILGFVVLVAAGLFARPPDWTVWALFAVLYVVLEMFTVEVNDRQFQSSSVMVVMTAGVIFAMDDSSSAVLGMASIMAAAFITPADIRERRWFQPMANFGQMVVTGAAAGLVLDLGLKGIGAANQGSLLRIAVMSSLAA